MALFRPNRKPEVDEVHFSSGVTGDVVGVEIVMVHTECMHGFEDLLLELQAAQALATANGHEATVFAYPSSRVIVLSDCPT